MDIIPKNRIRPHATSRPVIPNGPLVHDNSMTGLSSAPALRVKRHSLTIDPLKDSDLSKEDVFVGSAGNAASSAQPIAVSQGVSVEELIAKRGAKVVEPSEADAAEPKVEDAQAKPAEESEPEAKRPWEEFNQPDEPADDHADADAKPQGSVLDDAGSPDDAAAAEAAQLLAGTPVPHRTIAELEAVHSSTRRSPESGDDTSTKPEETPVQEETPQALTQSAAQPTTPKGAEPEVAAGDSLADALREDEPETPQEHSQALKDAMQEMSGKDSKHDKDDKVEKSDGHHELYGGKPVIIVHKGQGQMSAVAWVLWFIFCLGLALLIVNFLIDAGYIETNYNIPHTDIINN